MRRAKKGGKGRRLCLPWLLVAKHVKVKKEQDTENSKKLQ